MSICGTHDAGRLISGLDVSEHDVEDLFGIVIGMSLEGRQTLFEFLVHSSSDIYSVTSDYHSPSPHPPRTP